MADGTAVPLGIAPGVPVVGVADKLEAEAGTEKRRKMKFKHTNS